MATHVVTGISWGANSVLSCLYENRDNQDVKVIEGSLSAQMKKISFSISGKASVDFKEGDKDKNINFDVRIFGDILPKKEDLPTTCEGALQLMKQLPSLVANCNNGKGKPLTYRLIPISLLQKYLNFSIKADTTLKTLEEASLIRVVQFFDQIAVAQQELHDFCKEATEHSYCVNEEHRMKLLSLKNKMAVEETSLRSKLSTVLADVRSGRRDATALEELIQQFQSSQVSPIKVKTLLNTWDSLRAKISFATRLQQSGAQYIGFGGSLDEEVLKEFNSMTYVLFFTHKSEALDSTKWKGNRQIFFQEMKKKGEGHKYYAVDCDIHPNLLPKDASSCVQVIQGGKIISEDLLLDQEKAEKVPFAKPISGTVRSTQKPNKRVPLSFPCTGKNCNPSHEYQWICKKCSKEIEYGFDEQVYCNCGKTPVHLMEFKCTDPKHGLSFEQHGEAYLNELISKLRPFKELNILILGETGVGKSTWINGFKNFLTYETLEEAEKEDLCTLIPSKFTVCDENLDEIEVVTGTDQNESQETGQSGTQSTRVYPFHVGNLTIRLIDTPGIGDCRGIEQDKKNFENILDTLSNLEEIHGICILLKPNDAKITVMFRFCINELLTYLHRDASKNIIFCFTNTRGTCYRPGDSLPPLRVLLKENKNVEIAVSPKTVYCFDSEAYRFLAAVKNNPPVQFSDRERNSFAESWKISIDSTKKMLEHIKSLAPHPIQSTLNLNHARQLVLKMVRPLAEISRNNQTNKAILNDEKEDIEKTKETIEELEKRRMTTRTEIEVRRIDHPKTVCAHTNCVKVWSMDGGIKITEYETVCHDRCTVPNVKQDTIGDPRLLGCWAIKDDGLCRHGKCGHHYREHLHIYYDSNQVVKEVENQSVKESIERNLTAAEMKRKMIDEKNQLIRELDDELKTIEQASVRFAFFLKAYAIILYNDGMEMYLKHLIQQEENKVGLGGNRKTLDSLIRSRDSYIHEKKILEEKMGMNEGTAPTTQEVDRLVKELKGLKHSGKDLAEALDCVNYAGGRVYSETVMNGSVLKGKSSGHGKTKSGQLAVMDSKGQKSVKKESKWFWQK